MSKKVFILLVGVSVLVAAVLGWAWFSQSSPGPEASQPLELAEDTFVVRYDGATFSPQVIRVKNGTKVYFINESDGEQPMYIASDDHPTHEKYTGFDAAAMNGKFPATGENFEFVFKKSGRWGYHDHNLPPATGTVIVE